MDNSKWKQRYADFVNLFGNKAFFDKEATIQVYFSQVPPNERPHADSFEELYQIALNHVGKQSFELLTANQTDWFHELSYDETMISILLGALAYGVAREVDSNGTKIEAAIDKILPKGYDTGNPFDVKAGFGHRVFGHDPATFGVKQIPGDLIIKVNDGSGAKLVQLADFLGKDVNGKYSMWDLIWKFYGNNHNKLDGVVNSLKHIIVHFAKDLFTPAGLPLPFTALFNEYVEYENLHHHGLLYKGSLAQKIDRLRMSLKAGDFASFILIESFIEFYCRTKKPESDLSGFRHSMKLVAMGTCISIQMATMVIGEELQLKKRNRGALPMIPGGKINVLMTGAFFKIMNQEMYAVIKARIKINRYYDNAYGEDNE